MLDGLNALISCMKNLWNAIFAAPLYGELTWGYFLISCTVVGILVSFFIARLK